VLEQDPEDGGLAVSRSRNIKPGFFKNERLAECDPLARLLFAGLWCEADREGRLEDRPKRLKAEILPYDECDVSSLLDQLAKHGFIARYNSGGLALIAIPTFLDHQRPHNKEPESYLPSPDFPGTSGLIPDSPLLIPEEPNGSGPLPCPARAIVALYHEQLPELPKCEVLTANRREQIRARWRDNLPTLDKWKSFFTYVRQSPFLMGKVPPKDGRRQFIASLEWLTKAENFAKIAEEKYHRGN
jgi:hypothetical protein